MEAVSFDGIDIRVIARDVASRGEVAVDWLEVPATVDASDVEEYVVARFGEPLDLEVDSRPDDGEVVRGWVFRANDKEVSNPDSGDLEMIVVPFVRFPDGTRRELFDYTAELDREFRELALSVDPFTHIPGSPAPSRPTDRLEHELLELYSEDPELVELQIAGWLSRSLAEGYTYLVFDLASTGRYVQFVTHDGSLLRGEVSGDRHLAADQLLTADEHRALYDIGWNTPESCDGDCGNYWVEWERDTVEPEGGTFGRRVAEAARFAAGTLCRVFEIEDRDAVEVTSGPTWQDGD